MPTAPTRSSQPELPLRLIEQRRTRDPLPAHLVRKLLRRTALYAAEKTPAGVKIGVKARARRP